MDSRVLSNVGGRKAIDLDALDYSHRPVGHLTSVTPRLRFAAQRLVALSDRGSSFGIEAASALPQVVHHLATTKVLAQGKTLYEGRELPFAPR